MLINNVLEDASMSCSIFSSLASEMESREKLELSYSVTYDFLEL